MSGWYEVAFREIGTKRRRILNLDELVALPAATKSAPTAQRKRKQAAKRLVKSKE
jgi:hypothetical protein